MNSKTKHDINNFLQVVLWGLESEADDNARRKAKKALQSIVDTLKEVKDCDCK